MEALFIVLFSLGMGIGLVARVWVQPRRQRQYKKDSLDTVDEMFLYGETTGDDFYRMS